MTSISISSLFEPLDSRFYFPRNAKRAAGKIRNAASLFGGADSPARQAAEALAFAIDEYAKEIEKILTAKGGGNEVQG